MTQPEPASPLNPQGLAFRTVTLGGIGVTLVHEGSALRDMPPGFVRNAPVEAVQRALAEAGFDPGKVPNSYTVTVVRIGGRLVMFDTGLGENGGPGAGKLIPNLRAAGIEPGEISAIVITHYHPDHIGGLMTRAGDPLWPHLPIHVPAAEHAFWTDPASLSRLPAARHDLARRVQATLAHWPNLVPYRDGEEPIPGIRAVASPGHSAGHMSLLLSAGPDRLMVLGDVTNIPVFNLHHPGWHLSADDDPVLAEATRRRLLDRVAAERIPCTGYHWGMPGIGHVAKAGDGYRLEDLAMP